MAKVQTRRNVSLSADTYARIAMYCELHNISMSSFVETRIKEVLDAQPENLLDEPRPVAGGRQ